MRSLSRLEQEETVTSIHFHLASRSGQKWPCHGNSRAGGWGGGVVRWDFKAGVVYGFHGNTNRKVEARHSLVQSHSENLALLRFTDSARLPSSTDPIARALWLQSQSREL